MSQTGCTANWTQWGFHWHPYHNEPIINPPTPAQNNLAPTPTTIQPGSTTTNGANPTTPVANREQPNDQNSTWHPNQLVATNDQQTLATNPTAQPQPNDSYLTPWGDHLHLPKPPDTLRICLQNFGGWLQTAKQQKMIISATLSIWQKLTFSLLPKII